MNKQELSILKKIYKEQNAGSELYSCVDIEENTWSNCTIQHYKIKDDCLIKDAVSNKLILEVEKFILSDKVHITKGMYGDRYYCFTNTKGSETDVSELYIEITKNDYLEINNFIDKLGEFEVSIDQNYQSTVTKNIYLKQLIKVIEYCIKVEEDSKKIDDTKLINEFKQMLYPVDNKVYASNQQRFNEVCKQLKSRGYQVYYKKSVYFDFSEASLEMLAYERVRSTIRSMMSGDVSSVSWASRRDFINNDLEITRTSAILSTLIVDRLENINFMGVDESNFDQTLCDISNYIESKLKKGNDKFIKLADVVKYTELNFANELLTDEKITEYRKKLHCFRHHSQKFKDIREKYSKEEKQMLIAYGHSICLMLESII